MKIINSLLYPVKKFFKGMFAISMFYLVIFGIIFVFDSCKKSEYQNSESGKAKDKFLSALNLSKQKVGAVSFANSLRTIGVSNSKRAGISSSGSIAVAQEPAPDLEPIYLDFPPDTSPEDRNLIYSTHSVQELSNLVDVTNAIVQYEPTSENSNNEIMIQVEAITSSLNPLIEDAKQYLYAKGFSSTDIQDMLVEENGKQEDLIPFVIALTQAENQQIARNYSNPFINIANAKVDGNDYMRCAMVAIGADVLWSLSTSSAASWTVGAMKKAFGAVAKRMLGPIGVAISVVTFGVCIGEAYYD